MSNPPEKKRKVDEELWGDDDDNDFTMDELKDIDFFISSQATQSVPSPRALGRGRARSHSSDAFVQPSISAPYRPSHQPRSRPFDAPTSSFRSEGYHTQTISQGKPGEKAREIQQLQLECKRYKEEVERSRQTQYSKDGQIRILQENLKKKETELNTERQEKITMIEEKAKEKSVKEANLEKECEKLQTQLQFREQEIQELSNVNKKLESQKSGASSSSMGSATRTVTVPSPKRPASNNKTEKNNNLEAGDQKKPPQSWCRKMKLKVAMSKGHASGAKLVERAIVNNASLGLEGIGAHSTQGLVQTPLKYSLTKQDSDPEKTVSKKSGLLEEALKRLLSHSQTEAEFLGPHIMSTDTENAVLLLPIIERVFDSYISILQSQPLPTTHISPCVPSLRPQGSSSTESSSLDSVTSSVRHEQMESAREACRVEEQAVSMLRLLHVLVEYSPKVRSAVLVHRDWLNQCKQIEGKGEEALNTDTQIMHGVVQESEVLSKIMKILPPSFTQGLSGNKSVNILCLQIIKTLSQCCDIQHLERFQSLLSGGTLLSCFYEDVSLPAEIKSKICCLALDIACSLTRSPVLMQMMCSQSEDCLIYALLSYAINMNSSNTSSTEFGLQLIHFLSSLLANGRSGYDLLLEGECECGEEVVRCVCLILHKELDNFIDLSLRQSVELVRQGLSLLHILSQRDKMFCSHHQQVEHQYVELICRVEAVARETQTLETELTAIGDLWDFHQENPSKNSEEEEEEEEDMDTSVVE